MCGFFGFSPDISPREFSDMFGLSNLPRDWDDIKSLKYAPTTNIPTVSRNSPNQLVLRRWWLIPRWWKNDPYKIPFATFNARMEEIKTKATYRTPWAQSQRCLIPATWFYEFETVEIEGVKKPKKLSYRVEVKDAKVFGIAGLYEVWKDAEDHPIESVTMITCESVAPLNKIHKRQPVIIPMDLWEKWLDKETTLDDAYKLLNPWKGLGVKRIEEGINKVKEGREL